MFLIDAGNRFLLGAVFGRRARLLFKDRLLFGLHARHHFGLCLGHRLFVGEARRVEHALRLGARLFGFTGLFVGGLADQFFRRLR